MNQPKIAVTYTEPHLYEKALQLSEALKIDLAKTPNDAYQFLLIATPNFLGLYQPLFPKIKPFFIDFSSPQMLYRINAVNQRKELLAKAIGLKAVDDPLIIDATAGLGRDSFMLASLGFSIILLEKSPIIFALLKDGMQRASQDSRTAPIIERLTLIHTEAQDWLQQLNTKADVIYLDPMFPQKKKNAAAKKEMMILQNLLETCPETSEAQHFWKQHEQTSADLFLIALACATHRVVVKRPLHGEFINSTKANFSIKGKSHRFDVYIVNK